MTRLRALTFALPLVVTAALVGCDGDADDTNGDSLGDTSGDAGDGDGDSGDGDGDGDSGDGDGDGDGDGEPAACEAFEGAPTQTLIAATSADEAATAAIVPNAQAVYNVVLPEGAPGFIELQIPDWETTQVFFTTADIDYQITTEANAQVAQPREPAAACPEAGITDQQVFFPHWTPATIEFSATGPREIPLMIIQQP